MAIATPRDQLQFVTDAIGAELKRETARIIAEEADKAAKAVEQRLYGLVDHIALRVLGQYHLSDRGTHLIIEVRKPEVDR